VRKRGRRVGRLGVSPGVRGIRGFVTGAGGVGIVGKGVKAGWGWGVEEEWWGWSWVMIWEARGGRFCCCCCG
jgi:hypothetical protein